MATQLNRFYQLASDAIFRHDGTLDKLVGDQVMAFFGAPIQRENHARRAVETAVEIISEIADLAERLGLRVGAGISTGEAFVGNVGGSDVTDYTVLGDTVNVAARLKAKRRPVKFLSLTRLTPRCATCFLAPRVASCCSKVRANRSSPGRLSSGRDEVHRIGSLSTSARQRRDKRNPSACHAERQAV